MADLTHDSSDDAFHEIQLSGKQLVFLFMATTVISVVIFLCGVLVGRGVRAEGFGADQPQPQAAEAAPAPVPDAMPTEPLTTDKSADAAQQPPALSYPDRLSADKARPEVLKPREEPPLAAPETAGEPPASSPPVRSERPAVPPAASAAAQGARPGTWIVQVISLRDRNAAAQIVQRLRNRGYPAYLVTPTPGGPTQLYKVQVGKYGDRTEAQQIQARLKKEEQFDTWIVR